MMEVVHLLFKCLLVIGSEVRQYSVMIVHAFNMTQEQSLHTHTGGGGG